MVLDFVIRLVNEGLLLTLVLCAPPILISMMVGLMISMFQAVTQIQEQTLTFVPKMVIIFAVLAATGQWLGATLTEYTRLCFEGFPQVIP